MLEAEVTLGCVALMIAGVLLTVRLRHTRRTPSPLSGEEPFAERFATTAGRAGGMLAGAYLAGVCTVGAGGRLMMRVLAATSPDAVQGLRTEADEIVGDVSVGGSAVLVASVGIGAGVVGVALFSLLRRWLPDRSLAAGLVGVAIGAGVLVRPVGLLSADSSDFRLLTPVVLAVVFCLGSLALFGATFGVVVDWLAPRWPRPGWSLRGVTSVVPFAVLLAVFPLFIAAMVGVLLGTVAPRVRSRAAPGHSVRTGAEGARLGRSVVWGLGALGGLSVVVASGQVLAL